MKFVVYVLYSTKFNRTYIGQTADIEKRLIRHNKGLVISTRPYVPWEVVYTEEFESRSDSMKREKWLKSGVGRKFLKELLICIASA